MYVLAAEDGGRLRLDRHDTPKEPTTIERQLGACAGSLSVLYAWYVDGVPMVVADSNTDDMRGLRTIGRILYETSAPLNPGTIKSAISKSGLNEVYLASPLLERVANMQANPLKAVLEESKERDPTSAETLVLN